jgi:DNA polymerase-4
MFGVARGNGLFELARGIDARPVVADRELKSISVEDTFPTDLVERSRMVAELDVLVRRLAARLHAKERSGRTITLKVRLHDFTTVGRSETLTAATDREAVIRAVARRLLDSVDVTGGVRLLGVGVSSLADFAQQDLFAAAPSPAGAPTDAVPEIEEQPPSWYPGADVAHDTHGRGWVERIDSDTLTIRFETPDGPPGPSHRIPTSDPRLHRAPPP